METNATEPPNDGHQADPAAVRDCLLRLLRLLAKGIVRDVRTADAEHQNARGRQQ